MSDLPRPIVQLLRKDPRYKLDAYQFVRHALAYAQEDLGMTGEPGEDPGGEQERHLTGQQLCEAVRLLALEQFGYMAKVVLNSWGLTSTSDVGNIVYNLIEIGLMKKSPRDRREDFDNVFDFDSALQRDFRITMPE